MTEVADAALTEFEAAVFRALQADGRVPFTAVAQRLGVSEANVRRTVKQLIARDVFAITAVADPRLMGLESMAWLALTVRASHIETTAAALAGLPEIDYVAITTGAWQVMAEVACRSSDDLFGLLQRVRSLPGVQGTETFPYFGVLRQQFQWTNDDERPRATPELGARGVGSAPAELDTLDRVLINELQNDGRASFRDIAQRLGASERTISTRFTRLVDDGVVGVLAVGNPHALGFHGLAWLGFSLDEKADVEQLVRRLATIPQVSYLVSVSGRYDLMGEVVCRDPDHLLTTLDRRIGTIRGIKEVDVFYYLRLLYRNTAGAWGAARTRAGHRTEGEEGVRVGGRRRGVSAHGRRRRA
ncbi:MAG TPA: Lrp/AsnC family transcriptional regulator [Thermoleophilaceae bacterium]|jgi:Lrp/AsnC family transcriptional regulator for asnA, asnC and gidA